MNSGFGYEYPAGAAEDSNAPWNEDLCDACGYTYDLDQLDDDGICMACQDI